MKKFFVLAVIVAILASASVASAEDLGVQVIGEANEGLSVSLDDLQVNSTAEIPGYADVTVTSCEFVDSFLSVVKGLDISQFDNTFWHTTSKGGYVIETKSNHNIEYQEKWWSEKQVVLNDSKTQADFLMVKMDVLNKCGVPASFIDKAQVVVIYDDETKFNGWIRQYDFDLDDSKPLDPEDNFSIDPYYAGHYVFGCTLPNAVVNSDAPLRMEIKMGDSELTYNVRK